MKVIRMCILGVALICNYSHVFSQDNVLKNGKTFLTLFYGKKFQEARMLFDASVLSEVSESVLRDTESSITSSAGVFRNIISYRKDSTGGVRRIYYYCSFEKAKLDVKVVFSSDDKIAGFFITSHPATNAGIYLPIPANQ